MKPRSFDERQKKYWSAAEFRPPQHAAVAAFADPKMEFLQKHVSLDSKRVFDVACGNGVFTIRLDSFSRWENLVMLPEYLTIATNFLVSIAI